MSGANGDGRSEPESYADGGLKPLAAFDPARIGPYLLLGRLGAGGMGRVFLARSDSGRTVAVKVVHEEHVSDEQFRARFRREIEAAGRVAERHTAPVLDSGPDDDPPWVATGYVPGLSLEQVVRRHGPLPASSLHTLADGLLHALKDIHDAGIVHRDLKPSNVMLTVDGTKVIDFGIARAMEASVESLLTSTGMIVGSPGFMAPEQLRGQSAGPKSDVFTVGCVLTYAATGQLPFGQGADNQHAVMYRIVQEEPQLEAVENPALRALIARCLTKDVEQRPSVDELLADPDRVGPMAAGRAWLPADVLTHIARQTAKLLDAEVQPLREEPADRATVGLRPQAESDVAVLAAGEGPDTQTARDKHPRRRRTVIALPVVIFLTIAGGTLAILQPWSGDRGGVHAESPRSSMSPTSAGSSSPGSQGSSPSEKGKDKGKDGGGGKSKPTEQGDGDDQEKSGGSAAGSGDAASGATGSSGSKAGTSSGSGGSSSGSTGSSGAAAGGSSGSGSGSSSGSSGGSGGSSSGSGGSSTGSPPPAMTGYKILYTNSCAGACDMPLKVSWSSVSRATRYDIHYTNKGSNFTKKNVDTVYSTSGNSYTIKGPFSRDEICVAVRAANKYGASAWAETWCGTVPP